MFFLIPLYGKNAEVFFIKMSAVLFTNFHKNEKNVKKIIFFHFVYFLKKFFSV